MVDDADHDSLAIRKWTALVRKDGKTAYAYRKEAGKTIYMHRVILGCPKGLQADHKDGNGLNNQRENLRVATPGQNQCNRVRHKRDTRGICLKGSGYQAQISIGNKTVYLGIFPTQREAMLAYDQAAKNRGGEFAVTNL